MNIGLKEAAAILGKTEDELMYLNQTNKIQAGVDQDTLAWQFKLQDVLDLKAELEAEIAAKEEQTEEE